MANIDKSLVYDIFKSIQIAVHLNYRSGSNLLTALWCCRENERKRGAENNVKW